MAVQTPFLDPGQALQPNPINRAHFNTIIRQCPTLRDPDLSASSQPDLTLPTNKTILVHLYYPFPASAKRRDIRETNTTTQPLHTTGSLMREPFKGTDWQLPAFPGIILNHSRSQTIDDPVFVEFCKGIARFTPTMAFACMEDNENRCRVFRALQLKWCETVRAFGGRSRGARAAIMGGMYTPLVKRFVCFSFPLHQGLSIRNEELLALPATAEVLFIVGDEDAMCVGLVLEPLRRQMRARSWSVKVERCDHYGRFRAGREKRPDVEDGLVLANILGQVAGTWVTESGRGREGGGGEMTEMEVGWDEERMVPKWSEWHAPAARAEKEPVRVNVSVEGARNISLTF